MMYTESKTAAFAIDQSLATANETIDQCLESGTLTNLRFLNVVLFDGQRDAAFVPLATLGLEL